MADFRFTVSKEESGQELRILMRKHFDFSSRLRNKIKRNHLLMLNGTPAEGWHRANEGDVVSVDLPEEKSNFEPEDIPLDIVFEDEDILVINKPPGIVVHPTKGHLEHTIANALMFYMDQRKDPFKIRFVNRLDMDTSGLLLVAKNAYAQTDYIRSSDMGLVKKEYVALVHGHMPASEGTIDLPIAPPLEGSKKRRVDNTGAPSVTHYKTIEEYDDYSLVRLRLETGRTHQIRVHLSHLGNPIAGDSLYGDCEDGIISRQALHAASLAFPHPVKKEALHLEAPLPNDISHAINRLRLHESSSC